MSVILVAEQDASYAERIVEVLSSAGWDARAVPSREAAFEAANAQRPGLLIASASLPEASSLLAAFSRSRGGPGAVVLVPVAVAGRVTAADYQADALLDKPFSDDSLVQTVRRCLAGDSQPALPSGRGARKTDSSTVDLRRYFRRCAGGGGSRGTTSPNSSSGRQEAPCTAGE